ncbi:MAG: hypothetical protein PHU93_03725 [Candidatus Gracilibacteria bacterium]|nr:hypothetical protein [Candidatus Gracilibacteria bacterium]
MSDHGPSHGPKPKASSNSHGSSASMSTAITGFVCVAIAAILFGI